MQFGQQDLALRKPVRDRKEAISAALIGIATLAALAFGWASRDNRLIDPEHGVGYWLGITGAGMMVTLLLYPLRKRIRALSSIGSVGFWFRTHMILGLGGPLLILYHSRFSFGALNSAVALWAMLVVAGSGLIGRFFYGRVHRGYSGRKLEIRGLLEEVGALETMLAGNFDQSVGIHDQLIAFERAAVRAGSSFWHSAAAVIALGWSTRRAHARLACEIRRSSIDRMKRGLLIAQSATFFQAVRRAAEFAFYDRMLKLWHLLHLPLFVILVASVILHVVAVHQY